MEQLRMFIAITLSLLVFLVWNYFFTDPQDPQTDRQPTQIQQTVDAPAPRMQPATQPSDSSSPLKTPVADQIGVESRTITIDAPLYSVEIDTRGAVFSSFLLRDYRETVDVTSAPKELISPANTTGTLKLDLAGNSVPGLGDAVFSTSVTSEQVVVSDQTVEIPLTWVSPTGVTVEKRYTFSPNSYLIGLDITILNQTEHVIQDRASLSLLNGIPEGTKQYGFEGPSAMINNALEQIEIDSLEDKNIYTGKIGWMALQDRYFMTSIIPKEPTDARMALTVLSPKLIGASWEQAEFMLAPLERKTVSVDVYFGPKKISILKSFDNGLEKAINFGWFDFIARPCLWIMNMIYKAVPNYGLAIIILTILIKAILWPLGQKSYKSMAQMKRMQPLMAEIREKYKNDKRKMNEEVMSLYRTYKVNPMGGCLPMVAQIPVFFAFYRMLYEAIELRHAPFMGWINDLSAPDRLFDLGVSIPFMEPPYGIPVLTIIMGGTMFLQQKMQPPMGDPTQAKMMMFMPIIFTVIFINFSSGLVLYWLVNNILSISQQYLISKKPA